MRRLTYLIAVTLDGFIAGPDGSDPAGPGGFWPMPQDYIEALVAQYPETLPTAARNALGVTAPGSSFDTVLMGRRTYEIGLATGVPNAYSHLRTVVFSSTLAGSPDPAVEVVAGDPVERVRALKDEPGAGLWLLGGGSLAASLYDEIDDLILKIAPITIGAGVPLFGDGNATLRLRSWTARAASTLPSGGTFLSMTRPD